MVFTEDELKAKNVKELKELAKQLGAPVKAKKDDLVASIVQTQAAADGAATGLEDVGEELEDAPADEAPAAADTAPEAAATGAAADAAAGDGKHAVIAFNLESKASVEPKKANIVGVKVLSDAERAQLRAAKFGVKTATAPAAAAAGGKAVAAQPTLEEEIKRLERGVKYGKTSEADQKKLEGLKKKLEGQQEKQRLALDKVELMDPDRMAAREKKFGRPLLGSAAAGKKDIRDPAAMKKRAEKFGKTLAAPGAGGGGAGGGTAADEARKKARLERFAKK